MRLIEKVWFKQHPAKWLLVPLLMPLSLLFWLITSLRRLAYRIGIFHCQVLTVPVVVVGNIGIGGNGKTPVVIFLLEQCRLRGLKAGVISRGYGGNAPHYPYLLSPESRAEHTGDEPLLIYQRCQVPVAVGADRIASGQLLIEQGCDIIIADDGLQHYRLKPSIEIIVIDAKRRFGNGLLLPAGPLREGQWRLKQADHVILNGANANALEHKVADQIMMKLRPIYLCNLSSGEKITVAEFLLGHIVNTSKRVNAMAGIGDPSRFFTTLTQQQFVIVQSQGFVDHHAYSVADFTGFAADIPLLMTEKDAVKCRTFAQDNWWYLAVDADISKQDSDAIFSQISKKINASITR
jgi:tetraacyldisaccharide 4'-kinase